MSVVGSLPCISAQQPFVRCKIERSIALTAKFMSEQKEILAPLDFCLLLLRIFAAFLMIHHGLEKLQDPEGFTSFIVDQYFPFLPFKHVLWTYLASYTQIVGSVAIVLGIAARPALIGLSFTMSLLWRFMAWTLAFRDSLSLLSKHTIMNTKPPRCIWSSLSFSPLQALVL